jgi:hypothetical protein
MGEAAGHPFRGNQWTTGAVKEFAKSAPRVKVTAPLWSGGKPTSTMMTTEHHANPIPREKRTKFDGENKAILDAVDRKSWKVESVPVDKITSRQTWVDGDRLVSMLESKTDFGPLPTVTKESDGHFVVIDGNHRVALALLTGRPNVEVRVLDLNSWAPPKKVG